MKNMLICLFIAIAAFSCSKKDDRLKEIKQSQKYQKNNRTIRTKQDVIRIINSVNPTTKSTGVKISPLIGRDILNGSIACNPNDTLLYIVDGGDKEMVISANVKCNPIIAMFDSPGISILHELANPLESNSGVLDFIEQAIYYNQKPDDFNVYYNTKAFLSITEEVKPKVPVEWEQFRPFNKFIPNEYPAGCVAIATAQALMVTRHVKSFNDIPLDYDRLIKVKTRFDARHFPNETNVIGGLIHEIGKYIGTKYGKEESPAKITKTINLFTQKGNKMLVDNNPLNIRKTLKNYRNGIVIISSRSEKTNSGKSDCGGHVYIADGYRIYSDGSDMIHINFGSGPGGYNGYFLTNLKTPEFIPESPEKYPLKWHFYCLYK